MNKNNTTTDNHLDLTSISHFFRQNEAIAGYKRQETSTADQVQHNDVDLNELSKNPRLGLKRTKTLFEDELVKLVPALKSIKYEGEARGPETTFR